MVLEATAMIRWPTAVEPVNAIFATVGWSISASPAPAPWPGTMLTTPFGSPAPTISSPSRSTTSGATSAGFRTTVLPQASAGASFHTADSNGPFQGMIAARTPSGSRSV